MSKRPLWVLVLTAGLISAASAQQFVYPAKARGACLEGRGYTVK